MFGRVTYLAVFLVAQPSIGIGGAEIPTNKDNQHGEITNGLKESNDCQQAAAVQTRAMNEKESKS